MLGDANRSVVFQALPEARCHSLPLAHKNDIKFKKCDPWRRKYKKWTCLAEKTREQE